MAVPPRLVMPRVPRSDLGRPRKLSSTIPDKLSWIRANFLLVPFSPLHAAWFSKAISSPTYWSPYYTRSAIVMKGWLQTLGLTALLASSVLANEVELVGHRASSLTCHTITQR
jgi:hypothetical protein